MSPSREPTLISSLAIHDGSKPALAQGWTTAKVLKSIYNAGSSPMVISQMLGVADSMLSRSIKLAESRAICYFVAGLIGVPPGDIWPEFRSHRNGGTKRRGRRG